MIAESLFGHQLLDVGNLDWHERRQILVAVLGDQNHVLKPDAGVFLLDGHLRLNCEELAGFERWVASRDVVDLDTDRVSETAGPLARYLQQNASRP